MKMTTYISFTLLFQPHPNYLLKYFSLLDCTYVTEPTSLHTFSSTPQTYTNARFIKIHSPNITKLRTETVSSTAVRMFDFTMVWAYVDRPAAPAHGRCGGRTAVE